MLKPLLLVGFPRGFTSQAYRIVQRATGLREVVGLGGDGEVLNSHRLLRDLFKREEGELSQLEPLYDQSDEGYAWVSKVLYGLHQRNEPFIIKDVSQPFHVQRFLRENAGMFHVLYVKRNLDEVRFSLKWRRWTYVHSITDLAQKFETFPTLDVDKMLYDREYTFNALENVLGITVTPYNYIDADFVASRERFKEAFQSLSRDDEQDLEMRAGVPVLKFGSTYKIGYGCQGTAILAGGWSGPEADFVWSDGPTAEIRFYLERDAPMFALTLEFATFRPLGAEAISFKVMTSGALAQRIDVPEEGILTILVNHHSSAVPCAVSLQIDNPRRPADYGLSPDVRRLGLALRKVSLVERGANL